MDDTDLAGPLVFCLAFGGCLLLVRKIVAYDLMHNRAEQDEIKRSSQLRTLLKQVVVNRT